MYRGIFGSRQPKKDDIYSAQMIKQALKNICSDRESLELRPNLKITELNKTTKIQYNYRV